MNGCESMLLQSSLSWKSICTILVNFTPGKYKLKRRRNHCWISYVFFVFKGGKRQRIGATFRLSQKVLPNRLVYQSFQNYAHLRILLLNFYFRYSLRREWIWNMVPLTAP